MVLGEWANGRRALPGCVAMVLALGQVTPAVADDTRGPVGRAAVRLGGEYRTQAQYPVQSLRRHPWPTLAVAGGLVALIASDDHVLDAVAPRDELEGTAVLDAADVMGDVGTTASAAVLVAGFAAAGVLADSPRERETAMMLFESVATAMTWTGLIKAAAGRARPVDGDSGPGDWGGPARIFEDGGSAGNTHLSFPSGHSTLAWAAATVIARQYSWHHVVPVLAYASAATMSYSRLALHRHWVSDVVVGAMIGYGCASQVVSTHRESGHDSARDNNDTSWSIVPAGVGVAFEYRF